jgi:hypothetical protein
MGDVVKKEWTTPKLRILVRAKPEERILGVCKQKGTYGPRAYPNMCHIPPACTGVGQS